MTDSSYSLIRGCTLFRHRRSKSEQYSLGTFARVVAVTSPFQKSALFQLATGENPLHGASELIRPELELFLDGLAAHGFLNRLQSELVMPKRYLKEVGERDRAINQLRARAHPELAQIEWSAAPEDGGAEILAARSQYCIELSGRSRVMSLLYSILLESGVTRVRFADRFEKSVIGDLDIGFGAISESDLGLNYYQQLEGRKRALSLFPIDINEVSGSHPLPPILAIHYGDCDPEVAIDWSQQAIPHLLIHAPIGDEIAIGPLVLPGESPCIRCLSLYELDHWGFTRLERISLTPVAELPAAIAHYIAAIVAARTLHFIDNYSQSSEPPVMSNRGVGEVLYINFDSLTEPQVAAIARHPLCGCDQ